MARPALSLGIPLDTPREPKLGATDDLTDFSFPLPISPILGRNFMGSFLRNLCIFGCALGSAAHSRWFYWPVFWRRRWRQGVAWSSEQQELASDEGHAFALDFVELLSEAPGDFRYFGSIWLPRTVTFLFAYLSLTESPHLVADVDFWVFAVVCGVDLELRFDFK